jgi:hypothetical protein
LHPCTSECGPPVAFGFHKLDNAASGIEKGNVEV